MFLGVTAFPVKTGGPKTTGVNTVKACFNFPVKSGKPETATEKHGKSCKIRYVLDASNKSGREAVTFFIIYPVQKDSRNRSSEGSAERFLFSEIPVRITDMW